MTEQELAAIKARHEQDERTGGAFWWGDEHADRGALLAHVAELESILHDALREGGVELGRQLALGEALAALGGLWEGQVRFGEAAALEKAEAAVGALGHPRDWPPPAEVRVANEALRRHLGACVGAWDGTAPGAGLGLYDALGQARAYLRGEGV